MADTDRLHDGEDILRAARELREATAEDPARTVQAEVNARRRGTAGAPA